MPSEIRKGITMRAIFKYYLLIFLFVVSGCSIAKNIGNYTAVNIKGMNHTDVAINYFGINGYGGANIFPFGERGGVLLHYAAR
ncbi:hypothetical protein HVZ29_04255 [Escherichia coli]|nr:hypothetical protein HVZ29_04255 [Escherichia coli]